MMRNWTYFSDAEKPTAELVRWARQAMPDVRYDTMIGTGLSGSLVIPPMAKMLHKRWAIIRKDGEGSHADGSIFEGVIGERFVIVDDFVSSGATVARILDKVAEASRRYWNEPRPIFVGVYEYSKQTFRAADSWGGMVRQAIDRYNGVTTPPPQGGRECACGCGLINY